ncbi:asparagine synthase C-terminal domain-containing protein [Rhodobacteraceae bacterium]|nr:asparagine synthase C-terminal domain-containing protein [Paracoccaceae bacterium]
MDVFTDASGVNIRDDWKNSFLQGSGLLDKELAASLLTGEFHSLFLESSPDRALANAIEETNNQDPINSVLAAETKILLPGNNLVKPDRMAMANGLEVRSPYLDYRMVELAFKVPGKHKLKGGIGKAIPKAVLLPILGDDLTFRKKQMFTTPVGDWFKNDLEVFARNILLDGRLGERNLFSPHAIEDLLKTHIDGQQNHTRLLRSLISVEIWHRQFIDGDTI